METAIINVRTVFKQQDNASINEQELICKSFVEAKGLKLLGQLCDDGVSGAIPMYAHSAGEHFLSAADSGQFKVLVMESLDHLSGDSSLNLYAPLSNGEMERVDFENKYRFRDGAI